MRGNSVLTLSLSLLTLFLLACAPVNSLHKSVANAASYRWVQYVPGGVEARVITHANTCPTVLLDSNTIAMQPRSLPGENYPILVCALPIPVSAKHLVIEGQPLKLPVTQPQRILLLGDTGCRLKGDVIQACNDPLAWPFRHGAAEATQIKPDLVIHVGDFHYRETPCPAGNAGCADSPFGDNWSAWEEDFFGPVGTLLSAAPWALVRGNHEECQRGGRGWARILDPYAWNSDSGCLPSREPFMIDLGGITLAVMDVSTATEDEADAKQAEQYRNQYSALAKLQSPVWITQHRPIWAPESAEGKVSGDNKTLALAARNNLPSNVSMILSGHHHAVEVLSFQEDLPLQLVTGNGGDELSMKVPEASSGLEVNGVHVKNGYGVTGVFGYSMLERDVTQNNHWTFTSFDYDGKLLLTCQLHERAATCQR